MQLPAAVAAAKTVGEAIAAWVHSEYDYYQVCTRCKETRGVGERYD
jgi:hypothetical protein